LSVNAINVSHKKMRTSIILNIIMMVIVIICVVPLLLVLSISLTSENSILKDGYHFIPKVFSVEAYKYIFQQPQQILTSYLVTICSTGVGTILSLLCTASIAYVMSRRDFPFAKGISFYVFFTMLFSGGIVPWYILIVKYLNLKDTFLVLVLPYLVIPWFVLLMKGFMSSTPMSLIESAKIDGAQEYRIFFSIVIPINKPGLATVGLFMAINYWNDYYLSLMFIQDSPFITLQFLLQRILMSIDFLNLALGLTSGIKVVSVPSLSSRMGLCVLTALPIMILYPFFHKYFVKGIVIGAIKG
jgi:putative aldouronate transport system permease protein